jgi:hypothetical protein
MNLPDSFYIALCMTVLILGIVYWFWSQTQFLLRKINLLENIVYELKTICTTPPSVPVEPKQYPPAPSSVMEEEYQEEEDIHAELLEEEEEALHPLQRPQTPPSLSSEEEDLQPGGVGSGIKELTESSNMLESMTLKELRRLAEQRGIKGATELKKKELLSQLKGNISAPSTSLNAFFDGPEEAISGVDVVELSSA